MSDSENTANPTAEQWAAFQKIWGETFNKLMQLGFSFSPDSAPPEFIRQMRSGIFQALAQSWDQFLRSPQFMEGMKQWMENAVAFRKMSNEFFNKVRHDTQSTSREDFDAVMLAVRHLETRLLDRLETLAAEVQELRARTGGRGKGAARAAGPKRASKRRRGRAPRQR